MRVTKECENHCSTLGIQDPRAFVSAAGQNPRSIRAKQYRPDTLRARLEGVEFDPCLGIPHPHRLVRAGGHYSRPVRAKRSRSNGTGVPLEGEQVRIAEAVKVMPLPAAQIGPGALEQGQS